MSSGGFERVHQGGHHDVYCNGARHVTLVGGQFGVTPVTFKNDPVDVRVSACDCEKYPKAERVPA